MVFVDGSHAYECMLKDSETSLRFCKSPTVVVWHDYAMWPGVTSALNHLYREDLRFLEPETNLRYDTGLPEATLISDLAAADQVRPVCTGRSNPGYAWPAQPA